jgi:signal transduction histidine kinase/ligand-binding sensor domain-containing protein
LAFGVALLVCVRLSAERLPIQVLTVAQGLSGNSIHKIVRDSHGFLWFCTGEGLSRFDGHQFAKFSAAEGLPGQTVWDLLESRSGDYWVATNGGLVRLPGAAGGQREVYYPGGDAPSRTVLAVHESADGTVWAGTEAGLYRIRAGSRKLSRVDTGLLPESWSQPPVAVITEDVEGNLWFGGFAGIGRLGKDGRVNRWTPRHGFASYVVAALLPDFDGTIWAGTEEGLCHLLRTPRPGRSPAEHCYGLKDGLPSPYTQSVLRDSSGRLWVATLEGVAYAAPSPDGRLRFSRLTRQQGLSDDNVESLAEDIDGNLWFGSGDEGAMKMSREDVVQFGEEDGLTAPVAGFFEDLQGTLYAVTRSESAILLNRFDGRGFVPIRPALPPGVRTFGRGLEQVAIQDRSGDWWLGTGDGLLRYRGSGREPLSRVPDLYVCPGGRDGHNVFRLYEDSRGDVWWSTSSRITNTLGRWRRAEAKMEYFGGGNGLPPLGGNLPSAFVEDRSGVLWLGFESQGIARQRSGGGFVYFDPAAGWPGGRIRTAHRDVNGRLWFGSSTGLWRLDDPTAARPAFVRYTPAEGLASLTIQSLTSDRQGRIYVGTSFGVDRIDPGGRRIQHLSTSDGFPSSVVQAAYCDREGRIWFGVRHGAIRFVPTAPIQKVPPATARITSIRVRGIDRSLGAAGVTTIAGLVLKPGEDQIEFTFAAPRFGGSGERRYQYRLEGAGSPEWSTWSAARSVNFASLAPGSYRFLARAEESGGLASVTFRIPPPFWLSWWFRLLLVSLVAATIYLLFRYRMRTALERERLRTRIATDLHDDIGSSLSRIAIWSDVAAREMEHGTEAISQPLRRIGEVSREAIDSMSDIVWAVNPKFDRVTDLATRIRRYVSDLSAGTGIPISFDTKGVDSGAAIGHELRRDLFLLLKEALNNALRHSNCQRCATVLSVDSRYVTLEVADNGHGFDPQAPRKGNGLDNMARRAERLGGTLRIDSAAGRGARVELRIPLDAR